MLMDSGTETNFDFDAYDLKLRTDFSAFEVNLERLFVLFED